MSRNDAGIPSLIASCKETDPLVRTGLSMLSPGARCRLAFFEVSLSRGESLRSRKEWRRRRRHRSHRMRLFASGRSCRTGLVLRGVRFLVFAFILYCHFCGNIGLLFRVLNIFERQFILFSAQRYSISLRNFFYSQIRIFYGFLILGIEFPLLIIYAVFVEDIGITVLLNFLRKRIGIGFFLVLVIELTSDININITKRSQRLCRNTSYTKQRTYKSKHSHYIFHSFFGRLSSLSACTPPPFEFSFYCIYFAANSKEKSRAAYHRSASPSYFNFRLNLHRSLC